MNYGARQATVRIAEHDRAVLELIQIRLSVAGYGTCMARTGVLAMQSLEGLRPDALVIDRDLPELNGFEVLETLRGHGVRPTYPILFLMKAPSREDIQRAVGLGAALASLGRRDEAAAELREALRLNPNHLAARDLLSRLTP